MSDLRTAVVPDLMVFARPVEGPDGPGGPSLRYDPIFLQLRHAREADDPDLPRGEWERPLKDADWAFVEQTCSRLLAERSKDFQLAWWLTEAWLHRLGLAGLRAGLGVLNLLTHGFWESAHPRIESEDTDARLASFAWADDAIAWTLRVHLPLIGLSDHDSPIGNLDLWERTLRAPDDQPPSGKRKPMASDPVLPKGDRAAMLAHGTPAELARLAAMADLLPPLMNELRSLVDVLADRMGPQAPSMARLTDTLRALRHAVETLLAGRDPRLVAIGPGERADAGLDRTASGAAMAEGSIDPLLADACAGQAARSPSNGAIASREEAYRMLRHVADFLERTEPHSPTPYLVKRAVTWGDMSLAELMQEILRGDGDLSHYFALLGIEGRAE